MCFDDLTIMQKRLLYDVSTWNSMSMKKRPFLRRSITLDETRAKSWDPPVKYFKTNDLIKGSSRWSKVRLNVNNLKDLLILTYSFLSKPDRQLAELLFISGTYTLRPDLRKKWWYFMQNPFRGMLEYIHRDLWMICSTDEVEEYCTIYIILGLSLCVSDLIPKIKETLCAMNFRVLPKIFQAVVEEPWDKALRYRVELYELLDELSARRTWANGKSALRWRGGGVSLRESSPYLPEFMRKLR